jgi:hypothetical protein
MGSGQADGSVDVHGDREPHVTQSIELQELRSSGSASMFSSASASELAPPSSISIGRSA